MASAKNQIWWGSYHDNAPLHQSLRLSSTNARNIRYPVVNLPYLGGVAATKMYHYEMAVYMLSVLPAGGGV